MAKQRRGAPRGLARRREPVQPLDQETIAELVALVEGGQYVDAIVTMEELREDHPREPLLYKLLGMAYSQVGELGGAAQRWEEAIRLDPDDISLWRLLTGIYYSQGRPIHALHALRRYVAAAPDDEEELPQLRTMVREMEALLDARGRQLGVARGDAERGTLLLEQGQRALEEGQYLDAARRFRDAARALPAWTTPRTNLALAQFLLGRHDEAVAGAERVLAEHPDDSLALNVMVRLLVMLGRREDAAPYGERLWAVAQAAVARLARADAGDDEAAEEEPPFEFEKAADAFALLDWDERVVATLERLPREELGDRGLLLLGAALANTGRKATALEVLQELEPLPRAARLAEALRLNEAPPGGRFTAVGRAELLPAELSEQVAMAFGVDAPGDEAARATARQAVVARAPEYLPAFMASLWLDDEVSSAHAVGVLLAVGTPAALEAVRTFAFGRLGPDDPRLHAALRLREAGRVDANRPLVLWQDGRYQELRPPRYTLVAEAAAPERSYPPAVARLMEKALDRYARQDLAGAARFYRQVLERDPTVVDAEQHLGLIALFGGDHGAAEAHFARALELDPSSLLARCTLASLRLGQRRPAEARDLLIPLTERTSFRPGELGSYLFTTAELAAADGDPARARTQLRLLLAYLPEHATARLRLRDLEREEAERKEAQAPEGGAASQLVQPLVQPPGNVRLFDPRA